MRENEKHRSYSVAVDGAVRIYNITGFDEDNDVAKFKFEETGEKVFDVLRDFKLYSGSLDQDDFTYTTAIDSYDYLRFPNHTQQKPEDIQFFERNYTNYPAAYIVDVINKNPDTDIYDEIILRDLINDSFHTSGDYGSVVCEDEWGESNVGNFNYMDMGNNRVKIFFCYY